MSIVTERKTKFKKNWENFKANLKILGSSLMFPLFLLAFSSMILGITYIFPSKWLITQIISKISMSIFNAFTYLVYLSLIITFHKDKNKYTLLNSIIFLMVIVGLQKILMNITNLDDYLLTNSIFSMIICATIYIYVDKKNMKPYFWVGMGFLLALLLIPVFITIAFIIRIIGYLIGNCPFGINAFLYGTINRLLLPFGLHSLLIPTFTYSAVGGTLNVYDDSNVLVNVINGDSAIWTYMYTHNLNFQELTGSFIYEGNNYTYEVLNNSSPGQYQVGFLPLTTFIFPILGISYCIKNGWKKGKILLIPTLFTMCSGLTEITEYTYLYTNIYLYLIEVFFVGLSFMFCSISHVNVWISTGWFIDIILFGIIPSLKGMTTNWYFIPIIGISIGIIFTLLFGVVDKYSKSSIIV